MSASNLNVSRETIEALEGYVRLLEKWNKSINLVSKSTIEAAWSRHILDSEQVFAKIPNHARRICDLGSGGGFPGLVLAIIAREKRNDLHVVLVESDSRKCAFLSSVAAELKLEVSIENSRIEQIENVQADVMTARALASLNKLCGYATQHLNKDGRAIFLKGRDFAKEIEEAREMWCFDLETTKSTTDSAAAVLCLSNIKPR